MKITAFALLSWAVQFPFITFLQEERKKEREVWKQGERNDVNLNNWRRRSMAKYLQWLSKNHKIFHLTVLALPGGRLCTDHNIGMPNPLSSAISHNGSICPSEEGDSCRHKRPTRECCMSVPTLSWSLLFFAHSCKSKQDQLPEEDCCALSALTLALVLFCSSVYVSEYVFVCVQGGCTVKMTLLSFYRGFHSARAQPL